MREGRETSANDFNPEAAVALVGLLGGERVTTFAAKGFQPMGAGQRDQGDRKGRVVSN